jgi:D-sedoheptulose 7-phosphate isomerase
MKPNLRRLILESSVVIASVTRDESTIAKIGQVIIRSLERGGKLLTCGNGGSAADALHMAEELVGRYNKDRRSLPAIALTADSTLLTCIPNDWNFEYVFARQIEGLGRKGDVLVCFTTSGKSPNVIRAIKTARKRGIVTVALLGKGGGPTKGLADYEVIVESNSTARVQEAHTLILHLLLEMIDARFSK